MTACSSPDDALPTSTVSQALSSVVTNGSFETGDYTGWSFQGTTNATWGIASNGQTIPAGGTDFDFFTNSQVQEDSPGLPITYQATDGNFVAYSLQFFQADHHISQVVSLPSCQPVALGHGIHSATRAAASTPPTSSSR